jgi:hypothetical protein
VDYFYFIFIESLLRKMGEPKEQLLTGTQKNERAQVRQLFISRSKMGVLYIVVIPGCAPQK